MNHGKSLRIASATLLLVAGNGCTTAGPQISLPAGTRISGGTSLENAELHLAKADFGLAIEEFRKVLRDTPDSPAAIQGLAVCYDRLQRFDLSDRYFQEALALSPRDPGVYRAYAASLRSQGRTNDAAILTADMQTMLAMGLATAGDGVVADTNAGARHEVEKLALPPVPVSPAATAQADSTGGRTSYLERVSLSEVRLVTRNATPARRMTIDIAPLMAAPISTPRPTRIVNAVGRPGIAGRFRGYLTTRGWARLEKGDASFHLASSRVVYPPASRVEALRLVRALPFPATAIPARNADRITVLVGRNALPFDKTGPVSAKS